MYLVVMVVIVMIIGYGGMRVANGTMSTGALVAFLLYLFQIIFPDYILCDVLHAVAKSQRCNRTDY